MRWCWETPSAGLAFFESTVTPMTDSNDNYYDGAWGYCTQCANEGKARSADAYGNPLSDCCNAPISRDPVTFELTLLVNQDGLLVRRKHTRADGEIAWYPSKEDAVDAGERLKWLGLCVVYQVDKCVSELAKL